MRDLQLKLLPRLALLVMASALWWASCALPQRLANALVSDDWHTETPSSSPSQCPSLVPHPSLVWWVWFLCAPLSACVCVCVANSRRGMSLTQIDCLCIVSVACRARNKCQCVFPCDACCTKGRRFSLACRAKRKCPCLLRCDERRIEARRGSVWHVAPQQSFGSLVSRFQCKNPFMQVLDCYKKAFAGGWRQTGLPWHGSPSF